MRKRIHLLLYTKRVEGSFGLAPVALSSFIMTEIAVSDDIGNLLKEYSRRQFSTPKYTMAIANNPTAIDTTTRLFIFEYVV